MTADPTSFAVSAPEPHLLHARTAARLRASGCVFAEEEADLLIGAARTPAQLGRLVRRRAGGFPLEHILGWASFAGLRIAVGPGVFVPRRRTELLVDAAADLARPGAVVVDLCCGSGAVGAVLLSRLPVDLHAVDIDPVAVRCARRNLPAGIVLEGDLYEPLPPGLAGRVDVVVANAPYVPTAAIGLLPPEARDHEPAVALDGGHDGLDVLRRVIAEAPSWLAPGGHVIVQGSEEQAGPIAVAMATAGLTPRILACAGLDATAVTGRRHPPAGQNGARAVHQSRSSAEVWPGQRT